MANKVYVIGVGMTKFEKPGRREDWDYPAMARESGTKALADAGIGYEEIEQAVPAGLDLLGAVEVFARYYRRSFDSPDALSVLSLQITLLDMALHDRELGAQLAASIRRQEQQLIAVFSGRPHNGGTVTSGQAERLVTALRALFVGLNQGVILGLAPGADEQFFVDAARSLATGMSLADHDADGSSG